MFNRVVKLSCGIVGVLTCITLLHMFDTNIELLINGNVKIILSIISSIVSFIIFWYLSGLIIKTTPKFAVRVELFMKATKANFFEMILGFIGLIVGLIVANLISLPVMNKEPFGMLIGLLVNILLGYTGFWLVLRFKDEKIFRGLKTRLESASKSTAEKFILDTSVIIEGSIFKLIMIGIVTQNVVVPNYVVSELKQLADSHDPIKKLRGDRGLELLDTYLKKLGNKIIIEDEADFPGQGVDEKLINEANKMDCTILTNDNSLVKMAEIHGLVAISINAVAEAVRSAAIPGDILELLIVKEGRETGQGIGFLESGTMVIVENGMSYLGKEVFVYITSHTQTSTGKILFGRIAEDKNGTQ